MPGNQWQNNQGECPIYMRITIAGERYKSVQEDLFLKKINRKIPALWKVLDQMRSQSTPILILFFQRPTAISEKSSTKARTQYDWIQKQMAWDIYRESKDVDGGFEEHNQQMKALIGHEFSPLTFERYTTSKKHTHDLMKSKYKVGDIAIKKLNYEFIHNYEFWLKSVRKCAHNTAINIYPTSRRL